MYFTFHNKFAFILWSSLQRTCFQLSFQDLSLKTLHTFSNYNFSSHHYVSYSFSNLQEQPNMQIKDWRYRNQTGATIQISWKSINRGWKVRHGNSKAHSHSERCLPKAISNDKSVIRNQEKVLNCYVVAGLLYGSEYSQVKKKLKCCSTEEC